MLGLRVCDVCCRGCVLQLFVVVGLLLLVVVLLLLLLSLLFLLFVIFVVIVVGFVLLTMHGAAANMGATNLWWVLVAGMWPDVKGQCSDGPHVNWTAVREDLVTYTTLSEPYRRSRRCFGLDSGVWSMVVEKDRL